MAPAMTPTLTQADLGKLFNYDKATGTLVWKSHPSARHRNLVIVWCFITGEWRPAPVEREKPAVNNLYDHDLTFIGDNRKAGVHYERSNGGDHDRDDIRGEDGSR
jgi:hypothetical protein